MKTIKLCVTTDVHGALFPEFYHDQSPAPFGLSRLSTLIHNYRKNYEVILIDNGDFLQGTPFSTYAATHRTSESIMAKALNRLNYDYHNLGNHDFNYGEETLFQFLEDTHAPLLTSNINYQGSPLGKSVIHTTESGVTLGLIGLTTQYIPNWENPAHIQNMTFMDACEQLQAEITALRSQVDRVVVIYHGGLENDPLTNEPTEPHTGENQGSKMVNTVKGIDLLITGHQHRTINTRINGVQVMQCAMSAQEMMVVTLNPQTLDFTSEIISSSAYPSDPYFLEPFLETEANVQTYLDQTLGEIDQDLIVKDGIDARIHKHPIVSFTNQIQFFAAKGQAQLASAALFNQPLGFHTTITLREIVSNYIYPNTLVIKRISGKNLKMYLEQNADFFEYDGKAIRVNPRFLEPKLQLYNYDMVDGIDYEIDLQQPLGYRIVCLTYEGKTIQDDEMFTIILNNYRANGGGNFDMIAKAETVKDIQSDMVEIIEAFFRENPFVHVEHHDNIRIVQAD